MKTKLENVKIIQISAISDTSCDDYIYGLGNDGLCYRWDFKIGEWQFYKDTY